MQINPDKVIDAIARLEAAAKALIKAAPDDGVNGALAGECLKSAAALQASVQVAGLRTFHVTGDSQ